GYCSSRSTFDLPGKLKRADELDQLLAQPGVWDDTNHARELAREASECRELVNGWDRLERRARDLVELDELAENDTELGQQIAKERAAVAAELRARELDLLFTDPYATHNAGITISVGHGGGGARGRERMCRRMGLHGAGAK